MPKILSLFDCFNHTYKCPILYISMNLNNFRRRLLCIAGFMSYSKVLGRSILMPEFNPT